MEVADARRLRALEARNAKLKKFLAEQMLDMATFKEMLASSHWRGLLRPGSRRRAVDWAMNEKCYSQRQACSLTRSDPRVYRPGPKRAEDKALRMRRSHSCSASVTCLPFWVLGILNLAVDQLRWGGPVEPKERFLLPKLRAGVWKAG
jgi:hypothetical protein